MSSAFVVYTLSFLLLMTSLFMILLVLIQRGRGGGLAGAFGGLGGQSAFGTRAGDIFTKITVVVAILFILVAALLGISMRNRQKLIDSGGTSTFQGGGAVESEVPTMEAGDMPEEGGTPFGSDAPGSAPGNAEADESTSGDAEGTPATSEPAGDGTSDAGSGPPAELVIPADPQPESAAGGGEPGESAADRDASE